MTEEELFAQLMFIRNRTLSMLDATDEKFLDEQPDGFNNNIRWNLGHIFVAQEKRIHNVLGAEPEMPANFFESFNRGTSPSDWGSNVPTLIEIRKHLSDQPHRMKEKLTGRTKDLGVEPFDVTEDYSMKKIEEVVHFMIWHEGLHQGVIIGLKHAHGDKNLF
ncbi:hypothetical protein CEY16_01115 [Halalkalibacillus sediminis]|uniref:DinB-like domain-containing protein n=1 Tax=Halalkalibacillus sediminis TaxID=2018042 RepID=A0A2I0QVL8_9BACI|nr:DinB family protein [Halalkalibacillus sediminis]PKR78387.1 hypothetical protein CEY16_01115 [Halalkalibacillus sediminis]